MTYVPNSDGLALYQNTESPNVAANIVRTDHQ